MTRALTMKPVSNQNMLSSMEGGRQGMALNRVLNNSRMMYCDKCGFATADAALFRRHMNEHNGTKFHCIYCAKVSFSEAELNAHLLEHSKYRYKCPHCGQGYMRWLCLLKHIDRLHGKVIDKDLLRPTKPCLRKILPAPISIVSTSTPQPAQMVPSHGQKKSPPTTPAVSVNGWMEDAPRTLELNIQNAKKITEACASSLNGNTHGNTALTVSLPEEVTIPAGCKVELVEVKTVNGTKELKLRLVSKQENNSVVNDARTTAVPSAAAEKITHANINEPINLSAVDRRSQAKTVDRRSQAKTVNAEHPAVVKVNVPTLLTNQVEGAKVTHKRKVQDCTNFKWHQYTPKVSKLTLNTGGVFNIAGGVTQIQLGDNNSKVAPPSVDCSQLISLLNSENSGTSRETATGGAYINLVHSNTEQPRKETVSVKVEPGQVFPKGTAGLTRKREAMPSPSSKPSLNVSSPKRPAVISLPQDRTVCLPSAPIHATPWKDKTRPLILRKSPVFTNGHRQGWSQEPEGFPVISSVFSLSQQPQDDQGSIQPLMMALRGIIMDKTPITNGVKQVDNETKSQHCAPSKSKPVVQKETSGQNSVKVETHEKSIELVHVVSQTSSQVKEEETASDKSSGTLDLRSPKKELPASNHSLIKNVTNSKAPDSNPCLSKYVTVSLTRIDEAAPENTSKAPKPEVASHKPCVKSLGDCTPLYTMPLKGDQLVKRPGPNQPVVVLNHPKPRAPVQERAAALLDTEEQTPRCQILKMKLSKVIGQKYEVMGCTVRVCP